MSQQTRTRTITQTDRWVAIRERFLRDPLPVRLGELATSLSEAKSIADREAHEKIVCHYLNESEHYLEWGFPDADPVLQADLTELKTLITQLRENWRTIWGNSIERIAIGAAVGDWSQKILDRSGLLDYDDWREVFRTAPASSLIGATGQGRQ